MKLQKLDCPACGANINMDVNGRKAVFCPFCGSQFLIDTGETVITKNINKNINLNSNSKKEVKINNKADIIRAKAELKRARSQSSIHIDSDGIFSIVLGVALLATLYFLYNLQ